MEAGVQSSVFVYPILLTKNRCFVQVGIQSNELQVLADNLLVATGEPNEEVSFSPLYINETHPLVTVDFPRLPPHGRQDHRSSRQDVLVIGVEGLV